MNLFGQLVEIRTASKDLTLKIIRVWNINQELKWMNFEYFYDIKNHSIYLNWLDTKDMNIDAMEKVINKIFFVHKPKKEITSFLGNLMNNQSKKPKVFYFDYSTSKEFIYINKINLETKRNSNLEILELKIWSINYNS